MTKKWWVTTVVAVVLILVTVIVLIVLFHAPSKSVVTQPKTTTQRSEDSNPTPVDTAYFTMRLPAGFVTKSQQENATAQDVLQLVATKVRSNGQQVAINLATMPSDGLPGVASYNLRSKNPSIYTPIEFGGMPAGVPTFYSQTATAYEITGFWVNGGLYASISVSGAPNDKSAINQLYAQVLDSWRWR